MSTTTLAAANVLEKEDLQATILRSWDAFCNEIGFGELFLVGSEIVPHESCDDRIDILAVGRDGVPVVFELKRHRDKRQLLQAIAYAAMVSRWDAERFRKELGGKNDDDTEELRSLLDDEGFALGSPKVVLIAETFDPEVILAADWLSEFGVSIVAFAVEVVTHGGETLLSIDQKFPLAGVDDAYVRRSRRAQTPPDETSWDEALKDVTWPFAKRAIKIFLGHGGGSPHRRAFNSIYAGCPLGRVHIAFRRKYLTVYTQEQSPEAEAALRKGLGDVVPFKRWGNENTKNAGFTFTIETEAQLNRFLQAVGETEE